MIVKRPDNFFPDLSGYVDMAEDAAHSMKERLSGIFSRSAPIPEPAHTSPGSGTAQNEGGNVLPGPIPVEEIPQGSTSDEEEIEIPTEEAPAASTADDPYKRRKDYPGLKPEYYESGHTPLFHAVMFKDIETINILLKRGVNPDTIEEGWEWTPLYRAVRDDNAKIVEIFLKYGADPDKSQPNEKTPRTRAISDEVRDIFKKFDVAKAAAAGDLYIAERRKNYPGLKPEYYESGHTPLFHAVMFKDIETVNKLLESGVNPDTTEEGWEWTPLYRAVANSSSTPSGMDDNAEIVEIFLKYGADPDKSMPNGYTPRTRAMSKGVRKIFKKFDAAKAATS